MKSDCSLFSRQYIASQVGNKNLRMKFSTRKSSVSTGNWEWVQRQIWWDAWSLPKNDYVGKCCDQFWSVWEVLGSVLKCLGSVVTKMIMLGSVGTNFVLYVHCPDCRCHQASRYGVSFLCRWHAVIHVIQACRCFTIQIINWKVHSRCPTMVGCEQA